MPIKTTDISHLFYFHTLFTQNPLNLVGIMYSHFYPWKIVLIRHSQMRMIAPLWPVKRLESAVASCWSRNRPYEVFLHGVWSYYFAVSQAKRKRVSCFKIVSRSESLSWIYLLIGNEPFFHIFLSFENRIEFFINECSRVGVIWILGWNKGICYI